MNTKPPMLSVRMLHKHFVGGGEFIGGKHLIKALNGVTIEVRAGEVMGIVGESGCGKSTLAQVIAGLHRPTAGEVFFNGVRVDNLSAARRRRFCHAMQMIFQNPHGSLNPRMTVSQTLAEALRFHFPETSRTQQRETIISTLQATGLDEDALPRYPHQFSGGQRQRISIARALIVRPRFIIADEPVAALDVSVQAQILNLLIDLRETRQLAYLFITHDLSVVEHFADQVAVMYLGLICEQAATKVLFTRPRHPYTRILLEAAPRINKPLHAAKLPGEPPSPLNMPEGCPFHPRCPHANARCRHEPPVLQTIGGEAAVACHAVAEGRI